MCTSKDAKSTRDTLLDAALLCFSESGYEGTSFRMIAERSGCTASLIAHHFGNKEGLYNAVLKTLLEQRSPCRFLDSVVSYDELSKNQARAEDLLRRLVVQIFTEMHKSFTEKEDPLKVAGVRLWLSAVQTPPADLESEIRASLAPLRMQIANCIRSLRPDLPTTEIPFWISMVYGLCLGNTMLRPFNQLVFGLECYPSSLESMAHKVADISIRALGRREVEYATGGSIYWI